MIFSYLSELSIKQLLNITMRKLALSIALALPLFSFAQDDLINKIKDNKSDSAKKKFEFKQK